MKFSFLQSFENHLLKYKKKHQFIYFHKIIAQTICAVKKTKTSLKKHLFIDYGVKNITFVSSIENARPLPPNDKLGFSLLNNYITLNKNNKKKLDKRH